MEKDLRMEVFSSKEKVKTTSLHKYKLHSQKIGEPNSIIRSVVRRLRNYTDIGVFEDGKNIYSTEKLEETIPNMDFTLEYEGFNVLPVLENRDVYCALIEYTITQKLSNIIIFDKYRKYSCKSNITSKWIMTNEGFCTLKSNNKEFNLERKYDFWVDILDDGKAYLKINTSSVFSSNFSVQDYLQRKRNVVGMEVRNDWGKNNQTGRVVEICNFTVVDKIENLFVDNLKQYYIQKGERYRVENLPDDTKVIKVKLQSDGFVYYYPQALSPVLRREKIMELDKSFSLKVEKYIKRDMGTRLILDQDFINDIGILTSLNDLEFNKDTCTIESLGYKKGMVSLPKLVCGNDNVIDCKNKFQVFNHGFYRKPDKNICIGYLYPKNTLEQMKAVANAVYLFASRGEYQGKKDTYVTKELLNIQAQAMIKEEYELGDITDYKRAANRLKKIEGIDLVIVLVPNEQDAENPYNSFKSTWAKSNIPSQMISLATAELFARGAAEGNKSKYYLQNIILGILGKTGGIPWIVDDMPGNIDCFVGLDVGTKEKGIHYPASSVVFDKYGRFLGFYKPTIPQKGEKIDQEILQDIFDNIILSYEEHFDKPLKSILIHRDGFSNEDHHWYKNYFENKGIEYCIVEVRKNCDCKLMFLENGVVQNPMVGHCAYNKQKAHLVTTDITGKKGSPNPILIEKKHGNISMKDILTQVMNLSQLHIGSTHKTRLPITTEYADKMCKNREFIPDGTVGDKLFFL